MKFYIASRLDNADQVKKLAAVLKAFGWEQTYDWTKHGSVQDKGEVALSHAAEGELAGIRIADIVIVLLPGGKGTHAELGAANMWKKPVFLWSETPDPFKFDENTCAFYWNENVHRIIGDILNLVIILFEFATSKRFDE